MHMRDPLFEEHQKIPYWYVLYTRPRFEKKVDSLLWQKGLESYLPMRHNLLDRHQQLEERALLVSQAVMRLSGVRIGMMVHKLCKKAGIPVVTVHQFRHSCASDLIEGGTGLAQVQRILGHACIQSTCRYIQISAPERKEAMALHPINKILADPRVEGELCA